MCEKDCNWNLATGSSKNGKYLASIIDDSMITCDKIINTTKTITANFNDKKVTCKTNKIYILLTLLLITITLLIVVSICCYLITYLAKQKYLLPYRVTNNKLKEF